MLRPDQFQRELGALRVRMLSSGASEMEMAGLERQLGRVKDTVEACMALCSRRTGTLAALCAAPLAARAALGRVERLVAPYLAKTDEEPRLRGHAGQAVLESLREEVGGCSRQVWRLCRKATAQNPRALLGQGAPPPTPTAPPVAQSHSHG